jgi:hypothetical protein
MESENKKAATSAAFGHVRLMEVYFRRPQERFAQVAQRRRT